MKPNLTVGLEGKGEGEEGREGGVRVEVRGRECERLRGGRERGSEGNEW